MSNTKAFFITLILAAISFGCFVTVETPLSERAGLSNGLLYTLCGVFGVSAIAVITRQIFKN